MPGSLGDRVRELRERDKLTQGELAARIGTSASTLSRIEKGEIESPGSDIVVKLARVFRVSTDFLLGVTDYPDRKNYEVGQLGLSPEAARRLSSGEVDMNVLNRMVMNPCFPTISRSISSWLDGSLEAGMRIQNDMIASAMDLARPFPVVQSALSAMRLYGSFRSVTICSAVLSVVSALGGIVVSIAAGTPVGSTIVAADALVFCVCWLIGTFRIVSKVYEN